MLLALTVLMILAAEAVPWAFKYPSAWVVPLKSWINALMAWLRDDASFGLFTFQQLTRAISWLIEQPFRLAESLLSAGFVVGAGQDAVELWPPIPWFASDRRRSSSSRTPPAAAALPCWWRSVSSISRCSASGRAR